MEEKYTVKQINDWTWNIDDEEGDSAYLILGMEKALLIDTTMGKNDISDVVKKITDLPVEVALTHGHWDHACHAHEFPVIYVHPGDYELLKETWDEQKIEYAGKVVPVFDGDIIELGGRRLSVMKLPGHTPGSIVFIEEESASMFCGDAFGSGSGVLMAIGSTPGCLGSYKAELERFLQKIDGRSLKMYGGHRYQENGIEGLQDFYNPLSEEVVRDMILLCDKIIGKVPELKWNLQKSSNVPWTTYYVSSGKAAMWVTMEQGY